MKIYFLLKVLDCFCCCSCLSRGLILQGAKSDKELFYKRAEIVQKCMHTIKCLQVLICLFKQNVLPIDFYQSRLLVTYIKYQLTNSQFEVKNLTPSCSSLYQSTVNIRKPNVRFSELFEMVRFSNSQLLNVRLQFSLFNLFSL